MEEDDGVETETQLFLCSNEGCARGFKRSASSTKRLERKTLLDKAKLKYATTLEEGDSSVPTVSTAESEAEQALYLGLDGRLSRQKERLV